MPCYCPPPPYEGEEKSSANEAARLLCEMITAMKDANQPISRKLLKWWRDHRAIDLKMLRDPYYGKPSRPKEKKALQDISWADEQLQLLRVK